MFPGVGWRRGSAWKVGAVEKPLNDASEAREVKSDKYTPCNLHRGSQPAGPIMNWTLDLFLSTLLYLLSSLPPFRDICWTSEKPGIVAKGRTGRERVRLDNGIT